MESISKRTGRKFRGKVADIMVRIGVAYSDEELQDLIAESNENTEDQKAQDTSGSNEVQPDEDKAVNKTENSQDNEAGNPSEKIIPGVLPDKPKRAPAKRKTAKAKPVSRAKRVKK